MIDATREDLVRRLVNRGRDYVEDYERRACADLLELGYVKVESPGSGAGTLVDLTPRGFLYAMAAGIIDHAPGEPSYSQAWAQVLRGDAETS